MKSSPATASTARLPRRLQVPRRSRARTAGRAAGHFAATGHRAVRHVARRGQLAARPPAARVHRPARPAGMLYAAESPAAAPDRGAGHDSAGRATRPAPGTYARSAAVRLGAGRTRACRRRPARPTTSRATTRSTALRAAASPASTAQTYPAHDDRHLPREPAGLQRQHQRVARRRDPARADA